jgi:hypothetical protein
VQQVRLHRERQPEVHPCRDGRVQLGQLRRAGHPTAHRHRHQGDGPGQAAEAPEGQVAGGGPNLHGPHHPPRVGEAQGPHGRLRRAQDGAQGAEGGRLI